jgi:hypothetical protein
VLEKGKLNKTRHVWWGKISKSGARPDDYQVFETLNRELIEKKENCLLYFYCPYGESPSLHVGKAIEIKFSMNTMTPHIPEYYRSVGLPVSVWFKIIDIAEIGLSAIENLSYFNGRDYDPVETNHYPILVLQKQIDNPFMQNDRYCEIIEAQVKYHSAFISFGGPDEALAARVNQWLKARAVETFFFPDSAVPGKKLHRLMSDGVKNSDRVILLCSKNSLNRTGVLNELERVFEREAEEGGADVLTPISVDDFVFSEWSPERPDIADQVRSRVIAKLPYNASSDELNETMGKILEALRF